MLYMFQWIKNLFKKNLPIKKEVGGFEILDGVVLGAAYFSKDGKQSSALICPPIWAFNYGITNNLNRFNNKTPTIEEFQSLFNSLLDDIVAEVLIYLENRLKLIVISDKLKYKINSISEGIKAYKKLATIELEQLCDASFLKNLDIARGKKHHTFRRYDASYDIGDITYDTVKKLRGLVVNVRKEIQNLDQNLANTYKDYEIKIERLPSAIKAE